MSDFLNEQREIILSGLSPRYRKDVDSNFYKLADTIAAIFADFKDRALVIKDNVVTIANASSGFLDEWAFDVDLPRKQDELDDDYRLRLLTSWNRKAIVKEDIHDLVADQSLSDPVMVEVIRDRFWLGGTPTEPRVELTTTTDSIDSVTVPYALPSWSAPSVFSIGDTVLAGPNYASGGTFTSTEDASGNWSTVIYFGTSVPSSGYPVKVTLTPSTSASGAILDFVPFGFFGTGVNPFSYWRYAQTQDNLLKISGDPTQILLQTRLVPGYQAEIWTTNLPVGQLNKWMVTGPSDFSGVVSISDSNRIDNQITETKFSTDSTTVLASQDIARVLSVTFNGQEIAPSKRFTSRTIYLDTPLPTPQTAVQIQYIPNPIHSYDSMDVRGLVIAGVQDPKYALQIYFGGKFVKFGEAGKFGSGTRWGQLTGTAGTELANIVKDAHPAGILTTLYIVNLGSTIYGLPLTIYGRVNYKGIS